MILKNRNQNTIDKFGSYVCVVGGANIDIVGFSIDPLRYKDDNIGHLNISPGGVGRNIAENLVRLGIPTKLICPIGDDIFGQQIIAHSREIGLDISNSLFLENQASSAHISILGNDSDMALGLSDMSICEKINTTFIEQKKEVICQAVLVALETNLPTSILEKIMATCPNQRYLLDTVSGSQCMRAKNLLSQLFILKTNQIEAEILSGIKISSEERLSQIAHFFHKKGTKHVFITLGKTGAFYSSEKYNARLFPNKSLIVNTNGAGDAFSAGVIYGAVNNYPNDSWLKMGLACAEHTVLYKDTVSPEINNDIFSTF